MLAKHICLLGGTGDVGQVLAARLVEAGHRVRILTRHRERYRDLLVLPTAELIEGDVHNPAFLRQSLAGTDIAINLVGILNEPRRGGFGRAHVELPRKLIEACRATGVRRLLHMSSLNAAADAPSRYLQSKGLGEALVMQANGADLQTTVFRPSVIFGPRDSFTNRFSALLRLAPGVFPLACPEAKMQPVYVEDVVQAFVRALDDRRTFGQRYNLCGPKVYRLRELIGYLAQLGGHRLRIIGLNDVLSKLQAAVMEFAPGQPYTLDNYRSLKVDSTCPHGFPAVFGIHPAALEDIAPRYLKRRARDDWYAGLRAHARRD